jgi:hypothetical protein
VGGVNGNKKNQEPFETEAGTGKVSDVSVKKHLHIFSPSKKWTVLIRLVIKWESFLLFLFLQICDVEGIKSRSFYMPSKGCTAELHPHPSFLGHFTCYPLEIVLKKENAYRLCLVCLSIKCM